MSAIQAVAGAVQQAAAGASAGAGMQGQATQGGVPFAHLFQSMVQQSNAAETNASNAVTGLMSGSGVEVHDAMIATEKADMIFELGLQVRNKAVAAYQQMMNMQF
jgi:flagellar hook-basal body complex protein FliE